MDKPLFGGIEAGGTKFVCAIGTGPDDVRAEVRFPTTSPDETLQRAIDFFRQQGGETGLQAIGIGSFGPVDLNPDSETWGFITSTPKPGWANTDFARVISREVGVPVAFNTDVNAAALGEYRWGAAQGLDTFIYLTVGTGIGGGGLVRGRLPAGLVHPEMGHVLIPRAEGDEFEGVCPYHGACLEGMTSGPSIARRWGKNAADLPPDHPAWELEAHYLGVALANFIMVLSPQRIVLGGGVMQQLQLFPLIRKKVQTALNGYIRAPEIENEIDKYIVPPGLGNRSGVLGALALAETALEKGSVVS
jgi:fructokinase